MQLQPVHLKAAKLPGGEHPSPVIGLCGKCTQVVTKEQVDGGPTHRDGQGRPLHPDCFFRISWRKPN